MYSLITILISATLPFSSTETGALFSGEKKQIHIPNPILSSWKDRDKTTENMVTKFVTKTIGLPDILYTPEGISRITGPTSISEAGRVVFLRSDARDALWNMSEAFFQKFQTPLVVISGYRSADYQQRMWDLGKCTESLCAPTGYSEHQLGLAIDIFDATTETEYFRNPQYREYITWLQDNAHLYGWHQSYQKGEQIDAYEVEPWHWRYLGKELATKLKLLDMTYTEYIRLSRLLEYMGHSSF